MSKKTLALGNLVEKSKRTRYHERQITELTVGLSSLSTKKGANIPKIYRERELADSDQIAIEGEGAWNDEMNKFVTSKFPEASIEHKSSKKVEIYVPIAKGGFIAKSLWVDFIANLSLFLLCIYLLYYTLFQ